LKEQKPCKAASRQQTDDYSEGEPKQEEATMKLANVFTSVASVMALSFGTIAMATTLQDPAQQQQEMEQKADHISDSAITANVKSALMAQAAGMQINVETTDGVVTLSGEVATQADVSALERLARRVEGVKDVRNNLTVKAEAE
jgi:hyperosmotically inducible protein